MIEFTGDRFQAVFNIPKTISLGKLSKAHDIEIISNTDYEIIWGMDFIPNGDLIFGESEENYTEKTMRPSLSTSIYTYGHRNPQGMALHPETREIWATEHGPRGGDEVNIIIRGANYGVPNGTRGQN